MRNPRVLGFTLIEILVLVATIALLIAILLPALSRAREQAKAVVCSSNLKQLMYGMIIYTNDYKRLPATQSMYLLQTLIPGRTRGFYYGMPVDKRLTWDGANNGGLSDDDLKKYVPRNGQLFKYVRNEKVYLCPSDRPNPNGKMVSLPDETYLTPFGRGGNGRLSYSMNAYIGYKKVEDLSAGFAWGLDDAAVITVMKLPAGFRSLWTASRMYVLFEEHPDRSLNVSREGNFNYFDCLIMRHFPSFGPGSTNKRLTGRTNIGCLDGHTDTKILPWYTPASDVYDLFLKQPSEDTPRNLGRFLFDLKDISPW